MQIKVFHTLEERVLNLNNPQRSIISSDGRCLFEIAAIPLFLYCPNINDRKQLDRFQSLVAPVTFADSQSLMILS